MSFIDMQTKRRRALLTAVACSACLGAKGLESDSGPSVIYQAYLQSGDVPYQPGRGFYVPQTCNYVIDYYAQCGGSRSVCKLASGVCQDAQFPGSCCPAGYSCLRQNPEYWQCRPMQSKYRGETTGKLLLPAFGQCGGSPPEELNARVKGEGIFEDVMCPEGYACKYQDPDFSLCLPNPMYAPQQLSEDYILQLRYKTASPQDVPVTRLFPEYSAVGAEPGDSRAGDVEQYVFDGPDSNWEEPDPVELNLNVSMLNEFFDRIFARAGVPNPQPTMITEPKSPPPAPLLLPAPPRATPMPSFGFAVPPVTFAPPPPCRIIETDLVDTNGTVISLRGFNWFGFETGDTCVSGLWATHANPRNFSQVGDFATIVHRQQALGFNAVRLPFRFADLNLPPKDVRRACIADSFDEIRGNLTNPTEPYSTYPPDPASFPKQRAPIQKPNDVSSTRVCNSYLPHDTTLNRFLYVIQFYVANGFYVAIDFHASKDIETDRQVVANRWIFMQNWRNLLLAIQSLESYHHLKGRLFFDLMNEPDGHGFTWSYNSANPAGSNPNSTDLESWGTLFTDTASMLLAQEPELLFFAQGCGQTAQPGTAYGMGFGIDETLYNNSQGRSNARAGLEYLVQDRAVKAATILTPHAYGAQVTGWTEANHGGSTDDSGLGLPFTYYTNFAYLSQTGIRNPSTGAQERFPILLGELGNAFNSSYNATSEAHSDEHTDRWMHDLAQFANNLDPVNGSAFPHHDITSTFWWCWNGNSAPLLGLVDKPGWLSIQWVKINNLTATLGSPYYTDAETLASGGGFGLRYM